MVMGFKKHWNVMGVTMSSMIHDTDADDKAFLKIVIIHYAKFFSITLLYYSKTEKVGSKQKSAYHFLRG